MEVGGKKPKIWRCQGFQCAEAIFASGNDCLRQHTSRSKYEVYGLEFGSVWYFEKNANIFENLDCDMSITAQVFFELLSPRS